MLPFKVINIETFTLTLIFFFSSVIEEKKHNSKLLKFKMPETK